MLKILEYLVIAFAFLAVGIVAARRLMNGVKSVPLVPAATMPSAPRVGDRVLYTDKRTGNVRGYAHIECLRRDGLVTLRHGFRARQFSVHPSRILERS